MYSSNEVQSLIRKAIIGSGFDTGIAEDVSRAGVWLCQHGYEGADIILDAIGKTQNSLAISKNNESYSFGDICVMSKGTSIIDTLIAQLATTKECEANLINIDSPLLLLAFAAITSEEHDIAFEVKFSDNDRTISIPKDAHLMGNKIEFKNGCDGVIKCTTLDKKSEMFKAKLVTESSISISTKTWHSLQALAAKTYVPASEASRLAGAGAGLTDND